MRNGNIRSDPTTQLLTQRDDIPHGVRLRPRDAGSAQVDAVESKNVERDGAFKKFQAVESQALSTRGVKLDVFNLHPPYRECHHPLGRLGVGGAS